MDGITTNFFRCVKGGDEASDGMTFVQVMEGLLSLNAVGDTSGCVCSRWAGTDG